MVICETCGGAEFETYAGFMYCSVCQTQSQDYQEVQYEYHEADRVRRARSKRQKIKKTAIYDDGNKTDDGIWTSWEAFNYILYGMTQELQKLYNLPPDFQSLVLKIWACYLRKIKAGFISKSEELPKLPLTFKRRDARVLYNVDVNLFSSTRSRRSKSVCSEKSTLSNVSSTSESNRSLARKRSKAIASDYKEHILNYSSSTIADETLESLGRSDISETSMDDSSNSSEVPVKCMRQAFNKKNYEVYKNMVEREGLKLSLIKNLKDLINHLSKNKLLSMIHLALLMIGSEIQLSDLIRLIRESHLSYAKVTHFLPKDIRFSKSDLQYIDVIMDKRMPTHLKQRTISSQLAYFLKIEKIQNPNTASLVERYCRDLNLPDQIMELSKVIVKNWVPDFTYPKSDSPFPSFEAWAMVSIIFVIKLLFGLNDKTELCFSDVARRVNSFNGDINDKKLFVFEDWQKFIEYRKALLVEFHYPTQEQLNDDSIGSSAKFLYTLLKETKDDFRRQRFLPDRKYFMEDGLLTSMTEMLTSLNDPLEHDFIEFQPSLTPQSSHLELIVNKFQEEAAADSSEKEKLKSQFKILEKFAGESFKNDTVEYTYNIGEYLNVIKENNSESSLNIRFYEEMKNSCAKPGDMDDLLNPRSRYWILHYADHKNRRLVNFTEKFLDKMPVNFRWLITECSRMLEMNIRDVYTELVSLEINLNKDRITLSDECQSDRQVPKVF